MQGADCDAFMELRRSFIEGLTGRLAIIRGPDAKARDDALHKLAGAAGAYGLDLLGEQARGIQAALATGNAAAAQAQIEALAARVAALRDEASGQ
jgi:HPt (histidine-containing phosphotransfer) domain-containing protein